MTNEIKLNEYPLNHDLICKIPKKVVSTFSSIEVKVTSFDFTNTHIVFGTNAGCGFLLNRDTGHVIKVLCQSKQDHVSCVKLFNGLECQVALATKNGKLLIIIFSETTVGSKQVQKFSVGQIHHASVCSLTWSINGMKLYSGDVDGNIFCQEIDFKNGTCGSSFILKEETEIIQMEYCHKLLLVSTLEKSFLLNNGEKTMIGNKFVRKGRYGACFNCNTVIESELKLLATRPGMRVWISDTAGNVMMTLKMKDIIESSSSNIQLSNLKNPGNDKDLTFGVVMAFGADCLVTYHGSSLYVINHQQNKIVGEVHNLSNVLQVQATNTEILILCSETLLHRIAYGPDKPFFESSSQDGQRIHGQDGFTMQVSQMIVKTICSACHRTMDKMFFDVSCQFYLLDRTYPLKALAEDMKGSLSGVRKSITPMLDSLQSKMHILNVENFTTKIQAQANDLKKKVSSIPMPGVAERFISSNRKSSSDSTESSHSKTAALTDDTSHNPEETSASAAQDEDDTLVIIKKLLDDLINLVEAKNGNHTHLDGADFKFLKEDIDAQDQSKGWLKPQPQKGFRYEHIDMEETEKLVFSSKLRKKKVHKALPTSSNVPEVDQKQSMISDVDNPSQISKQESQIDANKNELLPRSVEPLVSEVVQNDQVEDEGKSSRLSSDNLTLPQNESVGGEKLTASVDINRGIDASYQSDASLQDSDEFSCKQFDLNDNNDTVISAELAVTTDVEIQLSNTLPIDRLNTYVTTDSSCSTLSPIANDTQLCDELSVTSCAEQLIPPSSTNDQPSTAPEDASESNKNESIDSPLLPTDVSNIEDDALSDATCSTMSDENPDPVGTSTGAYESRHQDEYGDEYFSAVKLNPEFYADSEVSPKSSDRWTTHTMPSGSLHRLEGSEGIVCFVNSKHHVYCIEESSGHKLVWNKFSKKAIHIAVSPSGFCSCPQNLLYVDGFVAVFRMPLLFRLFTTLRRAPVRNQLRARDCVFGDFAWLVTTKGNVYSAPIPVVLTNNPQKSAEIDLQWVLVGRKAASACLGLTEGWIIDFDGNVMRQTGLSRSQAADQDFRSIDIRFVDNFFITNSVKVVQISLTSEVVWLLDADGRVLCKPLSSLSQHSNWDSVDPIITYSDEEEQPVQFLTSDYQKTMWVVDANQKLWFRSNVTSSNPKGDQWWQVYLNEYLYQEQRDRRLPSVPHLDGHTDSMAWLSGSAAASSVAVSLRSVWVASSLQNLHVARGAVTGNQWRLARMAGIASSIRWSHISCSSIFSPEFGTWTGLIWVAQEKGDVICFTSLSDISQVKAIPPPAGTSSLLSVSASREAVWMLYRSGGLYARSGISPGTPTGVVWRHVDISRQLGDVELAHVSCGSLCVWAVDGEGKVYVRMGVNVTQDHEAMSPAWLSIDACHVPDRKFLQVTCGPSDINVWAVDDHGSTYVRMGVTAKVPIGKKWKSVQGPPVEKLTISNHSVWALCKEGSILCRCGITHNDCMGDYWKKMPGNFKNLTVTPYDELWAIDVTQRLRRHVTQLYCPPLLEAMRDDVDVPAESSRFLEADTSWELL